MISRTRRSFWTLHSALDAETQAAARRAYALFRESPDHPSLRFKKLGGYADVWTVRVNEQYRSVCRRSGDTVVWFWIGSHNAFDKMI